jgi:hypothetical protein
MTTQDFLDQISANFTKARLLIASKNKDYAEANDPFKNFRAVESMGVTLEQGILVRLSDKMSRLQNLIGRNQEVAVTDERVEDTILDMINYLNIILTYLQWEEKKQAQILSLPLEEKPDETSL